jgi:uncharacterized protein affecting Mg2+/Co2+ transport
MTTLKDFARAFTPKKTKNISEMEVVNIETLQIEERTGKNSENQEFSYRVAISNGEEYRVPDSVISSINAILEAKPSLKTVKVIKKGQGMATEYTVIPLD